MVAVNSSAMQLAEYLVRVAFYYLALLILSSSSSSLGEVKERRMDRGSECREKKQIWNHSSTEQKSHIVRE